MKDEETLPEDTETLLREYDKLQPIKNAEIVKFARRNCLICYGSGVYRRFLPLTGTTIRKDKPSNTVEYICTCANQQFLKKNKTQVLFDTKGRGFWRNIEKS